MIYIGNCIMGNEIEVEMIEMKIMMEMEIVKVFIHKSGIRLQYYYAKQPLPF